MAAPSSTSSQKATDKSQSARQQDHQLLPVTVSDGCVEVQGQPILSDCSNAEFSQHGHATILGFRAAGPTAIYDATVGQVIFGSISSPKDQLFTIKVSHEQQLASYWIARVTVSLTRADADTKVKHLCNICVAALSYLPTSGQLNAFSRVQPQITLHLAVCALLLPQIRQQ